MSSLSASIATLTLLVSLASAATFGPQNGTAPSNVPTLNLSVWHGSTQLPTYHVIPLAGADENTSITGPAVFGNQDTQRVNQSQIFFMSCDPADYTGFYTSANLYNLASQSNAAAVVMYATTSSYCKIVDGMNINGPHLFSMVGAADSANLTSTLQGTPNFYFSRVGIENSTAASNDNSNGSNNNNFQWSAPPGTALAMIILYAITGCITALFILIIITGTIRAHRHPERYGRRVVGGRTRQTRVGGLARAMLETLPIVKFGDRTEDKDVEMTPTDAPSSATPEAAAVTEKPADDGIAPAAGAATSADLPGCSICTEDFELGQDQRVLPCEHRFHPACIDPWLLNVSGTCPLCRVDLRPPEEPEEEETPEPEPITPASRRRSVLLAITNLRRPDGMTREERIEALRRYRRENDVPASPQTGGEGASDTGRSAQLRRLFNVRTWRTTRPAPIAEEP